LLGANGFVVSRGVPRMLAPDEFLIAPGAIAKVG
jgi:hypothetical protein